MDNVREDVKEKKSKTGKNWDATKNKKRSLEEPCESLIIGYADGREKRRRRRHMMMMVLCPKAGSLAFTPPGVTSPIIPPARLYPGILWPRPIYTPG